MDRFVLTDAQWAKMAAHCLGKPGDPGRGGGNNRRFIEAVLWIARTGSPWRDLPPTFGNWSSAYTRFRDWVKGDGWRRLFEAACPWRWTLTMVASTVAYSISGSSETQKGDSKPGHRALERRDDHQNPGSD